MNRPAPLRASLEFGLPASTYDHLVSWCLDAERRCWARPPRRRVKPDLLTWAREFLPAHLTLPPSPMHHWLADQLDLMLSRRGTKLNLLGPRGAAKSTIATLAYPLRTAVEGWEPYLWIISDTRHQARAHLENLKAELTGNARLAQGYPRATAAPKFRDHAALLANGVVIEAFGSGQRIRGRRHRAHRPTLIVCDDLQNDAHIASALQRERSRAWFHGMLLKAGTRHTNVVNLATALHRDALALELHRGAGWISRAFRAIEQWPDDMLLWQQWEAIYADAENPAAGERARAFYDARREAMDRGAVLLWPAAEDLYTLMCMRAESGPLAFAREKQCSPASPELCEWPEEYFDRSLEFETWPEGLRVRTIALDPSKGRDARWGDYSAFVLLGIHREGLLYVEADLARRPVERIVADGVELCRRFRPDAFGIEANQFQELLGEQLVRELRRQGLDAIRPWTLVNDVNKLVRIRRLSPHLAARRLRFKARSPSTQLLIDQLRDFPIGAHDDGPDALEMALRLAGELLRRAPDDGLGERLVVT